MAEGSRFLSGALVLTTVCAALSSPRVSSADVVLDSATHHLRSGRDREWETFAEKAEGPELVLRFPGSADRSEQALRLRQRDVKQAWRVRLNGRDIGSLVQDENEIVTFFAVPAGALRDGENELRVFGSAAPDAAADDVTVGDIQLIPRPRGEVLTESTLTIEVVDGAANAPVPCRITIADEGGGLVALGTPSGATLAVRPGTVYSAGGRADLRLPAGTYDVYAGRGFEYSLASTRVQLRPGESARRKLTIRRVVPTDGYVSCDTHVHTLTYSRHGDAMAEERMLTIAGEGVELPVATEHNLQVDYAATAEKMNVRRHFTPVMGNEVTTASLGHFNAFPIAPGRPLVNWRGRDWAALSRGIAEATQGSEPVVVLNHARDVHGGFRPFGPARHVGLTGESVDGKDPPANAMEVVNSGATRADPMELYRDWFGLLNRGRRVTPVGSSDSHDVSRYIVGQGRTYVRCADADPGRIDVDEARRNLLAGRVNVSYGLLCEITVAGRFGPGDLVPVSADVDVAVRVLGPEWTRATRVTLYANGLPVREADIAPPPGQADPAGVKWSGRWTLPRPKHDVHLVAIATGPGITKPYWPTAKPYQPMSPRWQGYVLGSTGAVWLDADGSGRFDSAYDYASRVMADARGEPASVVARLAGFDEAVAAQAASALRAQAPGSFAAVCAALPATTTAATRRGFEGYLKAWKETVAAAEHGRAGSAK